MFSDEPASAALPPPPSLGLTLLLLCAARNDVLDRDLETTTPLCCWCCRSAFNSDEREPVLCFRTRVAMASDEEASSTSSCGVRLREAVGLEECDEECLLVLPLPPAPALTVLCLVDEVEGRLLSEVVELDGELFVVPFTTETGIDSDGDTTGVIGSFNDGNEVDVDVVENVNDGGSSFPFLLLFSPGTTTPNSSALGIAALPSCAGAGFTSF